MLEHRRTEFEGHEFRVTPLTARLLRLSLLPAAMESAVPGEAISAPTAHRLAAEDAVAAKQALIAAWANLPSDHILRELDVLQSADLTNVPAMTLAEEGELQVLRALALEKALHVDGTQIEGVYSDCRHRGRLHAILILNNLGVISAKRQGCPHALDLFTVAIRESLAYKAYLRAPFYNCALILQRLHENGFILDPVYLATLGELEQLVPWLSKEVERPEEVLLPSRAAIEKTWTSAEIRAVYESIARYAHERSAQGLDVAVWAEYLVPDRDFFASFGDRPDKHDRQGGHVMVRGALACAEDGKFEEGLNLLRVAPSMNPDLAAESEEKRRQILESWRRRLDADVHERVLASDYVSAIRIMEDMDGALKRPGDVEILRHFRSRVHEKDAQDAAALLEAGDAAGAKGAYIELLRQDLPVDLRRQISASIVALLQRQPKGALARTLYDVNELRRYAADDAIVAGFERQQEAALIDQATNALHTCSYDEALECVCVSLALAGLGDRQKEKLRLAADIIAAAQITPDSLDSLPALQDPALAGVRGEIRKAARLDRLKLCEDSFTRFDESPALADKKFDTLDAVATDLELLDAPVSPETRIRLAREREAQTLFNEIRSRVAALSTDSDHSARTQRIRNEVWPLVSRAVDLAAGLRPRYAEEIAAFARDIEHMLTRADSARTLDEMDREWRVACERALDGLREALQSQSSVVEKIDAVCGAYGQVHGSPFAEDVTLRARRWLAIRGREQYRELGQRDKAALRAAIGRSRELLETHQWSVARQFRDEALGLLSEMESRFAPAIVSSPPPAEEQPAPPRRSHWFKSLWRAR